MPLLTDSPYADDIAIRALLLNCLTECYADLWQEVRPKLKNIHGWSYDDQRLPGKFFTLHEQWSMATPVRTDFARRQLLVELNCLVAMALGLDLQTLTQLYRLQFPVMQKYDADTWYDTTGRIVFTANAGLKNVGFDRKAFEAIKGAKAGEKFTRTMTDDTMPDGAIERTIEYIAPFTKCNRVHDYEVAWQYFTKCYQQ